MCEVTEINNLPVISINLKVTGQLPFWVIVARYCVET